MGAVLAVWGLAAARAALMTTITTISSSSNNIECSSIVIAPLTKAMRMEMDVTAAISMFITTMATIEVGGVAQLVLLIAVIKLFIVPVVVTVSLSSRRI